jgi:lipopolysaccharide transport system ATP-binding protein
VSAPIVELRGLGKSYRSFRNQWGRIRGWVTGTPHGFTDHWVLRNVSLAVQPGESLGIVGRNGAGKSTLLKLIAGVLSPTEGDVAVRGRVSALLELGMGFNPEFTGRENAVHACGLLGEEPAAIVGLLPWIEEFADVGEYFDQPMRTYSSGMYVRVAFAVATVRRPEVLIVDEALSVGDAAFQRKSFRRIEEFIAAGTSLLFVSHGIETVRRVCERAVWLERGAPMMTGSAKQVTEAYERSLHLLPSVATAPLDEANHGVLDPALSSPRAEQQYGDQKAVITAVEIRNSVDHRVNSVPVGEDFTLYFEVRFRESCKGVNFGMMLKTTEGVVVYGTHSDRAALTSEFGEGDRVRVSFALVNNLCPGHYFINCAVSRAAEEGPRFMHRRVDVAMIRVRDAGSKEVAAGIAHLRGRPAVMRLEGDNK